MLAGACNAARPVASEAGASAVTMPAVAVGGGKAGMQNGAGTGASGNAATGNVTAGAFAAAGARAGDAVSAGAGGAGAGAGALSAGASGMPAAGTAVQSGSGGGVLATPAGAGAAQGSSGAGAAAAGANASRATFSNPLNHGDGSDPFMVYFEGYYYLTATTWSSDLIVRRSTTIDGLKAAEPVSVWTGDQPSRCCNFWAPELHFLDGPNGKRWYLYFTAGPSGTKTDNQRNHVLESAGTDPLGPYTYKARIFDPGADAWAIDGSILQLADRLYFLYSAWEGDNQNLYIAPMQNPWTLSGARVRLSSPSFDWERITANVNEGPVVLQHADHTFVVYSASACWGPDYQLGMLTLTGSNPLDPKAWQKSSKPVFARADKNASFGPGHNGFFKSPDGSEDWIVYHANAAASGVCDTKRTTRVQKLDWNPDGTPDFGMPVAPGVELPAPSGE